MERRYIIYPYKLFSNSARALRDLLGGKIVRENGNYRPKPNDIIINWGNPRLPVWWNGQLIVNTPESVAVASNKIFALRTLRERLIATPKFATNRHQVSFSPVVVRHLVNSHSGKGIELITGYNLPQAPLYTEYIKNHGEYRVHVFGGKVIDYAKKKRHYGDTPTNEESLIRSNENGWVFTRENLKRLDRIEQLAIEAVKALGLDFGAVDIIKNENKDIYVLEVNTACGIGYTTSQSYKEAIINLNK